MGRTDFTVPNCLEMWQHWHVGDSLRALERNRDVGRSAPKNRKGPDSEQPGLSVSFCAGVAEGSTSRPYGSVTVDTLVTTSTSPVTGPSTFR